MSTPLHYRLAELLIFSAAASFRIYHLEYRSFWIDELFSVYYAQSTIGDLLNLLKSANQQPLYFLLLHFWVRAFGSSDFAVRLFSVLWGLIGLWGVRYLLKNALHWPERPVVLALLIVAVSPLHVYYSIEARF